jgi:hypothetical protein
MTDEERDGWIKHYSDQGVSLMGIVSLLYYRGLDGVNHEQLRKIVFKELQRIDSAKKRDASRNKTSARRRPEQSP